MKEVSSKAIVDLSRNIESFTESVSGIKSSMDSFDTSMSSIFSKNGEFYKNVSSAISDKIPSSSDLSSEIGKALKGSLDLESIGSVIGDSISSSISSSLEDSILGNLGDLSVDGLIGKVPGTVKNELDLSQFGIPGLKRGGRIKKRGISLVGENGPELLDLPEGAEVEPLGETEPEDRVDFSRFNFLPYDDLNNMTYDDDLEPLDDDGMEAQGTNVLSDVSDVPDSLNYPGNILEDDEYLARKEKTSSLNSLEDILLGISSSEEPPSSFESTEDIINNIKNLTITGGDVGEIESPPMKEILNEINTPTENNVPEAPMVSSEKSILSSENVNEEINEDSLKVGEKLMELKDNLDTNPNMGLESVISSLSEKVSQISIPDLKVPQALSSVESTGVLSADNNKKTKPQEPEQSPKITETPSNTSYYTDPVVVDLLQRMVNLLSQPIAVRNSEPYRPDSKFR